MCSDQQKRLGGQRPVDRRIMFNAILVVTLALGSYILRELYPEQPVIKWLFGGIRLILFWAVSVYIIHRIDIFIFGKKNSDKEETLK